MSDIGARQDINIFSEEVFLSPRISPVIRNKDFISISELLREDNADSDKFMTNRFGHRSQEFTDKHYGSHILFAGCSETVGEGLALEETWSFNVFKKIKEIEDVSGYYNLSSGGIGFSTIIPNIFKYCKKYGHPKAIFLNLPEVLRFYSFEDNGYSYLSQIEDRIKKEFDRKERPTEYSRFYLLFYHYYLMLEEFCETNGIKLFSFTWDVKRPEWSEASSTQQLFERINFKTFFKINMDDLLNHVERYILNNEDKKEIAILSRDGSHSGVAINDFWANFIFKKYLERD